MAFVSVKAWMSGNPAAIDLQATLAEALSTMAQRRIRHLPVVDTDRKVVGMLSLNDLRAALPGLGPLAPETNAEWPAETHAKRVREFMTPAPHTIRAQDALSQAADRMADTRVGALPVVDDDGRLVGLISETDALRALAVAAGGAQDRESS